MDDSKSIAVDVVDKENIEATKADVPEKDKENKDNGKNEPEIAVEDQDQEGDQEIQDPLERISELEQELKAKHERLLRALADLDNFRKRSRKEVEETALREKTAVLREILPAIDSVDLALSSAKSNSTIEGIIQGVEMIRKQFLTAAERFGLRAMQSVGQPFDPNFHEAVAQVPSEDFEPGVVMAEMRKGYMLGDRLLRPAAVVVAQQRTDQTTADDDAKDAAGDSKDGEISNE
jgi:molecular chaperone GrpE